MTAERITVGPWQVGVSGARTISPYVELQDFGFSVRMGFSEPGRLNTLSAAVFPREISAPEAVRRLRDLVKVLEWRFCPEVIRRPPAPPVSAMSAEYGS